MELTEFYEKAGGDYNEVIARLQSESMIKRFLIKFEKDPAYGDLQAAKKAGDISAAFRAVHTLKGVAATLGLGNLFKVSSALTEELRPLKAFPAEEYFTAVDKEYASVISLLSALDA